MLKTIRGFIPFDSVSEDLGFREVIRPSAFDKTLADKGADVLGLVEHDRARFLGRRASGTLRLEKTRTGLQWEVDVPDTSTGRDAAALVARNDLAASSFAFVLRNSAGERWSVAADGNVVRELLDVALVDCSAVLTPAYPAATVSGRGAARASSEALRRRNDHAGL